MKFNERNVAYFASCNSPIDKEGILSKRGEINRGYQRRWFILKGNLLFYLEKKGDRDPVGVIILEGCRVELADSEDSQFTFQISFPGDGARTYILSAYSQDEMESWMRALSCSSYDYMKAMVDELQRQLDELTHDSHGDGQMRPGRFSYVTTGHPDDHYLEDMAEHPGKLGIYDKAKTESLSHHGAPRQNAFQRNSVPAAQYSNPSYAIWDPLVSSNSHKCTDQGNGGTQSTTAPQFFVENINGGDVNNGDEASILQSDISVSQNLQKTSLNPNSATAPGPGRVARSVFYENVSTSPRMMPRSGTTRARFFTNINKVQGVPIAKSEQARYHEHEVRSFSEMHAEFGMLIVQKINEHRQRRTSSSSSSS